MVGDCCVNKRWTPRQSAIQDEKLSLRSRVFVCVRESERLGLCLRRVIRRLFKWNILLLLAGDSGGLCGPSWSVSTLQFTLTLYTCGVH